MDKEELEEIVKDEKFVHAVELASEISEISSGILQRELSISFPKAIKYIDAMSEMGMLTKIDNYSYKSEVTQDQSKALREGKEIVPINTKKIDMTSKLVEFLLRKKIKFTIETSPRSYKEDGDDNPGVEISIKVDGIPSFEIIYDLGKSKCYLSSIYELLSPIIQENYEALEEMFEADKGIFTNITSIESHAEPGYIVEIHLYTTIHEDNLDEDKLEEIYTYLINKTSFVKELAQVSRKARY